MDNNNEEKNNVMVSNLPLLFSDGNPTSVASMSVEDLQYFIPFLMKCILGCEPSGWAKHSKFKWWPVDVPWSPIILTKKHQTPNWRTKLQNVVRRCYEYNGCGYLLQFSAKLQQLIGGFKFKDNWDGTTSMFDSNSGKLLVTFRNENMNYDNGLRHQSSNQRPMLLPRLNSPGSPAKLGSPASIPPMAMEETSTAQMVEPPVCDIYLCDYCGADFSTLAAIKAHEDKCVADKVLEAHSSNNLMEVDTKEMDQAKFMWYLSLSDRNQTAPPASLTPAKVRPFVKKTCTLSDKRFSSIPFSSDLAHSYFKKTTLTPAVLETLVNRYDKLCIGRPKTGVSVSSGPDSANLVGQASYRLRPLVAVKRKEEWTHLYCFNKADRRERMRTISTGLTRRARELLRQCRKVSVRLRRLTPEEITEWTRPKPKPPRPLLQPWIQKSIANLPPDCTISLAPVDSLQSWMRPNPKVQPSLVVSRPEVKISVVGRVQQPGVGRLAPRSPPGLLPLITNAWSMQTLQSVRPKMNNQLLLPDLIPVQRTPNSRPSQPVVIRMPSTSSPKPAAPYSRPAAVSRGVVIDLCSSDEDDPPPKPKEFKSPGLDKPLFLPPGISITQIKREPIEERCYVPPVPVQVKAEQRNGTKNNAQCVSTACTIRASPPALKFMGQQRRASHQPEMIRNKTGLPALSMDSSLPVVRPIKLGTLSPEKREQMKQSLLKIQQKEGMTSPSNTGEKTSSPPSATGTGKPSRNSVSPRTSPLSSIQLSPNKSPNRPNPKDERHKELKGKGTVTEKEPLPVPDQRKTRRKRTSAEPGSCDTDGEDDSFSAAPNRKAPRLDNKLQYQDQDEEMAEENGDYSTVIEVDLGGLDGEAQDGSRGSSFGSLTPESRNGKKRTELTRLLEDECKELRRKGLEELPFDTHSNQRITRCRTKSLPVTVNKLV